MTAVSYVRRSSNARAGAADVSFDAQRSAIDALAGRHGDTISTEYSDNGKSGGSTNGRHGYKAMVDAIESGHVTVVYAYAITRLTRSQRDALDLWDLCKAKGVVIRTADGMDSSTTAGMMQFDLLALTAKWEREWATQRTRAAIAERKAKGHLLGSAGYGHKLRGGSKQVAEDEDVMAVIRAFRESNDSFSETARLLNSRGIKPRWAQHWSSKTVADVVRRELGESNVPKTVRGPKARHVYPLSGLVRCGHCGGLMTTKLTRVKGRDYPQVFCGAARFDATHPRPFIHPQSRFMPSVKEEADRLRVPFDIVQGIEDDTEARTEVEGRLARTRDLYDMGDIDKSEYIARRDALTKELARLDAQTARRDIPPTIDWDASPESINAVLSALWESVTLTPDGTAVDSVQWRVPEWRAAD